MQMIATTDVSMGLTEKPCLYQQWLNFLCMAGWQEVVTNHDHDW